jgi:5,6,7,8-tetrahydromethanopterin hydro-lyase
MSAFYVGEALVIEGSDLDNVAHIDLLIGPKDGPVGVAFANALANQSSGHSNLLAVLTPNLAVKPATVMITKVTIKGAKQAVQMFGPAQAAVARAVVDSVSSGVIPRDRVDDLCILVGVFIHWEADDDKKIFDFNYRATREAIERALRNQPSVDTVIQQEKTAKHPFASGAEESAGSRGAQQMQGADL